MLTKYFCSICHEDFRDEITTLRCGHTFHDACFRLSSSTKCPECRSTNINPSFRIYINSREIDESTLPIVVELKKKLEEQILTASVVVGKLKQAEEIYLRCRELQKQKEDIEEENNYLKTVELSLQDELRAQDIEIGKLREELKKAEESKRTANTDNEERHKVLLEELEERGKQIQNLEMELRAKSVELEKEIRNSTMLLCEKMELKRALYKKANQLQSDPHTNNPRPQQSRRKDTPADVDKSSNGNSKPITRSKRLSDEQFAIFQEAKKILSRYGFNVYYEGNTIYAQKSQDASPLIIESKEQIADLYRHEIKKTPDPNKER